ncbi:MAG: hypothetical protein KatS3mg031_1682 [Chitinophagales bacterium]|nr:MAG: hypothetical protein KatS3mg031_1682 [Chitinophagales bacterium]
MHGSGTPNGGGNVTGSVTVRQEGYSSNIRYNYWGSPVSGANVSILGGNLYYYDPSSALDLTLNGWLQGWIPASGTMQIGKGYASTGGGIVSFSGAVNNAPPGSPITIAVEKNDGVANNVGFNLIGNPFPSAVSASDFVAANSGVIAGALYFWDDDGTGGTGSNWGMGQDYAVWTGAGAVGPNSGKTFTGHIASGQGFFVEKLANGVASVQFTNSMRTTNNDVFFRQQALQRFWISVTNPDGAYNETLLAFLDDASDGPDVLYDAKKLKGNPFIALYSKIGNEDYAIQALPLLETDRTIALGLDAATPGQHVLRLKLAEGLDETVVIMLEDRTNGVFQNLRQNPEYVFTTTAGQNLQRFFLHLNPEAEFILTDETCAGNDGVLELVQPGSKTWSYTITSEGGTIVSSGTLSGSIVLNNLAPGTYHAELVDAGGYRVLKDFILGSKQLVKAVFQPSATEVFINEPVYFANLSTGEAVYRWDFGDGSIAEGVVHPQHIFTEEGIYRVQLFASTQDCQDMAQAEIRVHKAVVGILEPGIGGVRVFHSGNRIFVNKGPDSGIMRIVITNLLGQKCYDFKTDSEVSVVTLQEAENKIYFVTTMQDGTVQTQKLLITR